ncbi:uncharacterized protein V1518DRAFT_199556 [Limtongia smithiae]|uniref:uncharacterized protein n=1 Tax=Limtongia smithiae TaxID=1125753 RepID=UPI0034CFC69B
MENHEPVPTQHSNYTPTRSSVFDLNTGHLHRLRNTLGLPYSSVADSPVLYSKVNNLASPYTITPRPSTRPHESSLRVAQFKSIFAATTPSRLQQLHPPSSTDPSSAVTTPRPASPWRSSLQTPADLSLDIWLNSVKSRAKRALHENEQSEQDFNKQLEDQDRRQRAMFTFSTSILARNDGNTSSGYDDQEELTVKSKAFEELERVLLESKNLEEAELATQQELRRKGSRKSFKRRRVEKQVPIASYAIDCSNNTGIEIYEDSQSRSESELYEEQDDEEIEDDNVYRDENEDPNQHSDPNEEYSNTESEAESDDYSEEASNEGEEVELHEDKESVERGSERYDEHDRDDESYSEDEQTGSETRSNPEFEAEIHGLESDLNAYDQRQDGLEDSPPVLDQSTRQIHNDLIKLAQEATRVLEDVEAADQHMQAQTTSTVPVTDLDFGAIDPSLLGYGNTLLVPPDSTGFSTFMEIPEESDYQEDAIGEVSNNVEEQDEGEDEELDVHHTDSASNSDESEEMNAEEQELGQFQDDDEGEEVREEQAIENQQFGEYSDIDGEALDSQGDGSDDENDYNESSIASRIDPSLLDSSHLQEADQGDESSSSGEDDGDEDETQAGFSSYPRRITSILIRSARYQTAKHEEEESDEDNSDEYDDEKEEEDEDEDRGVLEGNGFHGVVMAHPHSGKSKPSMTDFSKYYAPHRTHHEQAYAEDDEGETDKGESGEESDDFESEDCDNEETLRQPAVIDLSSEGDDHNDDAEESDQEHVSPEDNEPMALQDDHDLTGSSDSEDAEVEDD